MGKLRLCFFFEALSRCSLLSVLLPRDRITAAIGASVRNYPKIFIANNDAFLTFVKIAFHD